MSTEVSARPPETLQSWGKDDDGGNVGRRGGKGITRFTAEATG